jgi:hypothetical protein
MNDDYLWDKTGQADPEIQELEEILGTMRYQPRPLKIPQELLTRKRRNYFPLLAIAATVLLALVASGVWLRIRTQSTSQPREAKVVPAPPPVEHKTPAPQLATIFPKPAAGRPAERLGTNNKRRHRSPVLGKREREEALAAKEQLMLALRVASEKLSLVQRKTQNTTPANQIKNQHRVG